MKNASRNTLLAAAAALTIAVAPSARADMRIHVNLPHLPSPRQVLRHLPVPPLPVVSVDYRGRDSRRNDGRGYGRGGQSDGRRSYGNNGNYRNNGNFGNRGRDDGWQNGGRRSYGNYRNYGNSYRDYGRSRYDDRRSYYNNYSRFRGDGRVFVEGFWVLPPFPGAIWVDGYYDEWAKLDPRLLDPHPALVSQVTAARRRNSGRSWECDESTSASALAVSHASTKRT